MIRVMRNATRRRPNRAVRVWVVAFLALVPLLAQGPGHQHASVLDAAQCAVCHWGQSDVPSPVAPLPDVAEPQEFREPAPPGVDGAPARPRLTPPARGPPAAS